MKRAITDTTTICAIVLSIFLPHLINIVDGVSLTYSKIGAEYHHQQQQSTVVRDPGPGESLKEYCAHIVYEDPGPLGNSVCWACNRSPLCGYCAESGGCYPGNSSGPTPGSSNSCQNSGSSDSWFYGGCSPCSNSFSCEECVSRTTSRQNCGWCIEGQGRGSGPQTGLCTQGDNEGSFLVRSICSRSTGKWIFNNKSSPAAARAMCPTPLNDQGCDNHTTCSTCLADSKCGWCTRQGRCSSKIAEEKGGGSEAGCSRGWLTEKNQCSDSVCNSPSVLNGSCTSCLSHSNVCGYCAKPRRNQTSGGTPLNTCMEGDVNGPYKDECELGWFYDVLDQCPGQDGNRNTIAPYTKYPITPVPTTSSCYIYTDCYFCTLAENGGDAECQWCTESKRCEPVAGSSSSSASGGNGAESGSTPCGKPIKKNYMC